MQSEDPNAPVVESDDDDPQQSTVEFHMSKLEQLDHGDVVAKMQLVKTVASLLKARKLGKVHPEKQEEEVVEQPKALHTEDDENDEAWENLSSFAIPFFRRGRQTLVTTQMLHHDPTNEVTVNVTVPVTLQPGDPFMVNTSNGVVVPNVPWADHKWLNAAAELQDTIVVPGTKFRYRVSVFRRANVPRPIFADDKKVQTELPDLDGEELRTRLDAVNLCLKDAADKNKLLDRQRCRAVVTSTLRVFITLVMAILVLPVILGPAIFHGQFYTDWLIRVLTYDIVPYVNSTDVETIFDEPLGMRARNTLQNATYTATVLDGMCTKEGRAWQSYFNILSLDPEWPDKFQTCFGHDDLQVPVLQSLNYNTTMYGVGAELINVTLPQDFWSQWQRIMVHNNVFLFVMHWLAFVCGVTCLAVYLVSGTCFVCFEALLKKQWERVSTRFTTLYISCMEDVSRNSDRCAEIAQAVVDGEGGEELLAIGTKRRPLGCLPGYRWLTLTVLLIVEYFFDFAVMGACIYTVLVLLGPTSYRLVPYVYQGFYVVAMVVLAFCITIEREPLEGQPPCLQHPQLMRQREPGEQAVIGCCGPTRAKVKRFHVLPALVTCLVGGGAIASTILFFREGLDDQQAMLLVATMFMMGVVQAVVRACSLQPRVSQDMPFWWPLIYCCLRPGTQRFLRERILLSYYVMLAKKVTKPFQDDIQVLLTDYGKGDWQPRWDAVTVAEVNEELEPGYGENDGLEDEDREAMSKLGFNDPRRHAYRKAAEQRVKDARRTLLRVGSAKHYSPVPTLKELGREIDLRFKPMFGAGAACRLTSYVSCTVQFQTARELAGFAAYLKGYAFADPGSPKSLMRFVGVKNRFVKQGLTESSRKEQKWIFLRWLCPKLYSIRWRQKQKDEHGAVPEHGEGFDSLDHMPQEGFSDVTCYIRYRGMVCEVRLVLREMLTERESVREQLKITRCRNTKEFVAHVLDDWTPQEIWDEVPPPHLQPCVRHIKWCRCCKFIRNDGVQLATCLLCWVIFWGTLIAGALQFPTWSDRGVMQWCDKPQGEHYTEFMGCHSWLPFFCTPGLRNNITNSSWASSYEEIHYGQPKVCETLCLSPYAGEYYEDTHTWICNTPYVAKQMFYNTTTTSTDKSQFCAAHIKARAIGLPIDQWLGDSICDDKEGFNTRNCDWDGGDCCAHTCGKLKAVKENECGFHKYSCKGFATTKKRFYINATLGPCPAIADERMELIDNTKCNVLYNIPECRYDGGDCCEETCGASRTPDAPNSCYYQNFDDNCKDPVVLATTTTSTTTTTITHMNTTESIPSATPTILVTSSTKTTASTTTTASATTTKSINTTKSNLKATSTT